MSTGTNYSQEVSKDYNTLPTRVAETGPFEDLISTRDYKQHSNIKLKQINSFNWKWMDLTVQSHFSVTHICSLYTVRSGLNVLAQIPTKSLWGENLVKQWETCLYINTTLYDTLSARRTISLSRMFANSAISPGSMINDGNCVPIADLIMSLIDILWVVVVVIRWTFDLRHSMQYMPITV